MAINHVKNIIESGLPEEQRHQSVVDVMTQYFACYDESHFHDVARGLLSSEEAINNTKPFATFEALTENRRQLTMALFRQKELVNQLIDENKIKLPASIKQK